MIPLLADSPRKKIPWMTLGIALANIMVFFYQAFFGPKDLTFYTKAYGLVPSEIFSAYQGSLPFKEVVLPFLDIFTSIFMHGGLFHLGYNMLFLFVFGRGLEACLGGRRLLFFYLLAGVLASMTHVYFHPDSITPLVGASGAISGVLGGYFMLFPHYRVLTLVPIFFYLATFRIPAAFFLGIWFLLQVLNSNMGGMVAWDAHIGGFLAGFILIRLFAWGKKVRS